MGADMDLDSDWGALVHLRRRSGKKMRWWKGRGRWRESREWEPSSRVSSGPARACRRRRWHRAVFALNVLVQVRTLVLARWCRLRDRRIHPREWHASYPRQGMVAAMVKTMMICVFCAAREMVKTEVN